MATLQAADHSELEVVEQTPKPSALRYSQPSPDPRSAYTRDSGSRKRFCGLRPTTFFLVLTLICVIVAATVGGGVGGSFAVSNAKNAKAASIITITKTETEIATGLSATTTSSSPSGSAASTLSIPTTGTLPIPCPLPNPSNEVITLGSESSTFSITCGADFVAVNGVSVDIVAIIAYSLHDCAQACASYNRDSGNLGCKAATFNSNLTHSVPANFGTCFLKSNTAGMTTSNTNSYAGIELTGT